YVLDLPSPRHDPAALKYFLEQCKNISQNTGPTELDWTARVRELVMREIAEQPTIDSVAAQLAVSVRTLRRRLAEEGANFREILSDTRLAIGHELLEEAQLDVSTVAWRVGYSEPSCFVRAFVKKFGYSPGTVKRRPKAGVAVATPRRRTSPAGAGGPATSPSSSV
ncbi:MAG: AraC family transcriptional regulator, partial [Caulobacterales bacterium]|nr:AraC family transcriptional regulator [Caulobacterales bacterium]